MYNRNYHSRLSTKIYTTQSLNDSQAQSQQSLGTFTQLNSNSAQTQFKLSLRSAQTQLKLSSNSAQFSTHSVLIQSSWDHSTLQLILFVTRVKSFRGLNLLVSNYTIWYAVYLGGDLAVAVVKSVVVLLAWCTVSLNLLSMVSFSFNLFGSSGVNSFEVLILALLRLRDFSLRLLIVESTLVVVWWWLFMVAGWWTGVCCTCCCWWWVIEEGNGLVWPKIRKNDFHYNIIFDTFCSDILDNWVIFCRSFVIQINCVLW